MIFLDTNIFVRFLAEPESDADRARSLDCHALFEGIARGDVDATTSHVIVAEVLHVLTSPRLYRQPKLEAADRLRWLLTARGFHLPERALLMRAFEILQSFPRLGFEDAHVAATVERDKIRLYSYDHDYDRVPGIAREEPPSITDREQN